MRIAPIRSARCTPLLRVGAIMFAAAISRREQQLTRPSPRFPALSHNLLFVLQPTRLCLPSPQIAHAMSSSASPPMLFVAENTDALSRQLLHELQRASDEAIRARGAFHVALSGGSLPAAVGRALVDSEGKPRLDTSKWHWWFADERCAKRDSPDSNYGECKKSIFDKLPPIEPSHMHAIEDALVDRPEEVATTSQTNVAAAASCCSARSMPLLLLPLLLSCASCSCSGRCSV